MLQVDDTSLRPLVLCIDVEPSERQLDAGAPHRWRGWDIASTWVDDLRTAVLRATGSPLAVCWFVRTDPQVERVFGAASHPFTAHRDLVDHALEAGDSFGTHVHAWRGLPDGTWVEDQADAGWTDHCIDVALAGFQEGLGVPCRLTRMGSRFMSNQVAARLAHHRVVVDLSVEPGWSPVPAADRPGHTADLPDYRRLPRRPYRPAISDFRQEAKRPEDGHSTVFLPLAAPPVREASGLRARISHIRRRGWRNRQAQPVSLSRMGVDRVTADRVTAAALSAHRPGPLAFAIRTDWDRHPEDRVRVTRSTSSLLAHPSVGRQRWIGPEEAVISFGP